jgi:glucosamine-6-phosphate deaminase
VLQIKTSPDRLTMGRAAAAHAAATLRECIRLKGHARVIAATGASQFDFLDALTSSPDIDWPRVELAERPADIAFVGIGENGHLAFNDPPADFTTDDPYIIVTLDEACRRQQVGEGWFSSVADVPTHAISMSVRQILTSIEIVAVVPDARKAAAVKACVEGPVSPMAPASILQTHPNTTLYLDFDSAALLSGSR